MSHTSSANSQPGDGLAARFEAYGLTPERAQRYAEAHLENLNQYRLGSVDTVSQAEAVSRMSLEAVEAKVNAVLAERRSSLIQQSYPDESVIPAMRPMLGIIIPKERARVEAARKKHREVLLGEDTVATDGRIQRVRRSLRFDAGSDTTPEPVARELITELCGNNTSMRIHHVLKDGKVIALRLSWQDQGKGVNNVNFVLGALDDHMDRKLWPVIRNVWEPLNPERFREGRIFTPDSTGGSVTLNLRQPSLEVRKTVTGEDMTVWAGGGDAPYEKNHGHKTLEETVNLLGVNGADGAVHLQGAGAQDAKPWSLRIDDFYAMASTLSSLATSV